MYCLKCNKEYSPEHKFCFYCGSPLTERLLPNEDKAVFFDAESPMNGKTGSFEDVIPKDDGYYGESDEDEYFDENDDNDEYYGENDEDDDYYEENDEDEYFDADDDNDEYYEENDDDEYFDADGDNDAYYGEIDDSELFDAEDDNDEQSNEAVPDNNSSIKTAAIKKENKKPDYTEIGIQKLKLYDIHAIDVTNKSGETKRFIEVKLNNPFKFCPDFNVDRYMSGKGFLYNDHVIMAFYNSGSLGIYKIKSHGRKVSLLFSVSCSDKGNKSFSFYKADDGRYILTYTHTIIFFDPNNIKSGYEIFKINNHFTGISALYSGNRILLKQDDILTPDDNDSIWFDGKTEINIMETEWIKRGENICINDFQSVYPFPFGISNYISHNKGTVTFTLTFGYDSMKCERIVCRQYVMKSDGRVFLNGVEIHDTKPIQIDSDITGYEKNVSRMLKAISCYASGFADTSSDIKHMDDPQICHFFQKSPQYIDMAVYQQKKYRDFAQRVKYDIVNDIIYISDLDSYVPSVTIKNIDTLLCNFMPGSRKNEILEKFCDRLDWIYKGLGLLNNKYYDLDMLKENIIVTAGFTANKKIYFSYPPVNSETKLPISDSEIYGLLLIGNVTGFSNPVALRVMLDQQIVYYCCLSDDDVKMIGENKILWKEWYRSRKDEFRLLFKMCNGHLMTCNSMPLPKNSPSDTIFGIDETVKKLSGAGISANINNLVRNGINVDIDGYHHGYDKNSGCQLSYEISFFQKEKRREYISDFNGVTLCSKGMLTADNNKVYLLTDLSGEKKEIIKLNEKIISLLCTERYLFVTTCIKEEVTSKEKTRIGGLMDLDLEDEIIHYTERTRTRLPSTHVYDLNSNRKLGTINKLGSLIKVIRSSGSYAVNFAEESSYHEDPKTYTISSSPDRIVADLRRIAETT